jgi:cell wall-associated NlpC family hydrolase
MVLASMVHLASPPQTASQAPSGLVAIAEKYIGVSYHMGATNTRSGQIDCSHFVAQVFREAGGRAPDPPVHNQESYGDPVWRTDQAYEVKDRGYRGKPIGTFDDLKLGDRIIIQKGAENPPLPSGFHHTGIYVGPITYGGKFYRYGVIHAGPPRVGVNNLTDSRLRRHLVFVVRDKERWQ